jgi:hypothetical protein
MIRPNQLWQRKVNSSNNHLCINAANRQISRYCDYQYLKKIFISEHLGLALALNVPVFVVVTKIDMCPPNVLQDTLKLLARVLKSPGCRKIPMMIQNKDDVVVSASNFVSERYATFASVKINFLRKNSCNYVEICAKFFKL